MDISPAFAPLNSSALHVARWASAFRASAVVVVLGVATILTFSPQGAMGAACYAITSICGGLAMYAAHKMRDAERMAAVAEPTGLCSGHSADVSDLDAD